MTSQSVFIIHYDHELNSLRRGNLHSSRFIQTLLFGLHSRVQRDRSRRQGGAVASPCFKYRGQYLFSISIAETIHNWTSVLTQIKAIVTGNRYRYVASECTSEHLNFQTLLVEHASTPHPTIREPQPNHCLSWNAPQYSNAFYPSGVTPLMVELDQCWKSIQ